MSSTGEWQAPNGLSRQFITGPAVVPTRRNNESFNAGNAHPGEGVACHPGSHFMTEQKHPSDLLFLRADTSLQREVGDWLREIRRHNRATICWARAIE
eukprot:UN14608